MKKNLILIILCTIFLVFIPITIYWWNFKSTSLSNSPTDWGTFGDFIGGTVNTIVGIVSLIVLAWITYIVAKTSSQEAFKQQIILKRMEAYQVLSNHMINSNLIPRKVVAEAAYFKLLNESNNLTLKDAAETIRNIQNSLFGIHELYQCIISFNMSYGHLFEYDFDGEDFTKLLVSSNKLSQWALKVEQYVTKQNFDGIDDNEPPIEFYDHYDNFTNSLRTEMSLKLRD